MLPGPPRRPRRLRTAIRAPTDDITIADYVGRYPPFYYALVGLPTLALVSAKGVYGARLVSGALAAAMLALAVTSLRRCRGSPLLGAGLALAMTPMALYLGASINPNGLEVAAAISAWVAAMALASQAPKDVSASGSGALGISVVVLILTRAISPLWWLFVALAFVGVGSVTPLRHLLARRSVRGWLIACARPAWARSPGIWQPTVLDRAGCCTACPQHLAQ